MTNKFAKVAFVNNASGARIEGEFIADTGPTWMVKPVGKAVQVLPKSEWQSAAPSNNAVDDLLSMFGGRL